MANMSPSIEIRKCDDHYKLIISSPLLDDATAEALGWMSGREAEAREALTVLLSAVSSQPQVVQETILKDLFIEVTSRCNAHCEHCGSSCGDIVQKDEIGAEDLKRTLKDISERYNANEILLNITGGEPFIREDLPDIVRK